MSPKSKGTLLDVSFVGLIIGVVACLALICVSLGCISTTEGGAEWSVGMRNDNFLVLRHTVDGDKVDKRAAVAVAIDPISWQVVKEFMADEKPAENISAGSSN
jgi:hypothetical protein